MIDYENNNKKKSNDRGNNEQHMNSARSRDHKLMSFDSNA
jgi:hypothetical protein